MMYSRGVADNSFGVIPPKVCAHVVVREELGNTTLRGRLCVGKITKTRDERRVVRWRRANGGVCKGGENVFDRNPVRYLFRSKRSFSFTDRNRRFFFTVAFECLTRPWKCTTEPCDIATRDVSNDSSAN